MVDGALIGTTEFDIFSLDPSTCAENWRTHEEYPAYILPTNRGAAYLDGMLFRGTQDGRVLAYDFKTGKRLWETTIGDAKKGEDRAGGADRLGGPRLHRQRRRRLQGRQGAHVRARRQDRQDRLGILSRAQVRGRCCPRARRALRRSTVRLGKMRRAFRSAAGEPGLLTTLDPATGLLYVPVGNPAPDYATASARERISSPAPSWCSTPRPALTKTISKLVPKDWHDWDVSNPPSSDQDDGGQEADGGVAEGRTPLRL